LIRPASGGRESRACPDEFGIVAFSYSLAAEHRPIGFFWPQPKNSKSQILNQKGLKHHRRFFPNMLSHKKQSSPFIPLTIKELLYLTCRHLIEWFDRQLDKPSNQKKIITT